MCPWRRGREMTAAVAPHHVLTDASSSSNGERTLDNRSFNDHPFNKFDTGNFYV